MLQPKLFIIQTLITNVKAALGTAANYTRSGDTPKSTTSPHIEHPLDDPNIVTLNIDAVGVPDVKDNYTVAVSVTAVAEYPGARFNRKIFSPSFSLKNGLRFSTMEKSQKKVVLAKPHSSADLP